MKKLEDTSKEELFNIIKKNFQDTFNPQHLYCWLMDMRFEKKRAREIEKKYEVEIYRPMMRELKEHENSWFLNSFE